MVQKPTEPLAREQRSRRDAPPADGASSKMKAMIVALIIFGVTFGSVIYYKNLNLIPEDIEVVSRLQTQGLIPFSGNDLYRDFSFDLHASPQTLSSLSSSPAPAKKIVLHFWASWCGPCVDEFPALLAAARAADKTAIVYAISEDQTRAEADHFFDGRTSHGKSLKALILENENFHVVMDTDLKLAKLYGAEQLPDTFIFNPDQKLLQKYVGAADWSAPEVRHLLGL